MNSIFKSGLKRKTLLLTGILILVVVTVQFILSFAFLSSAFNEEIAHVRKGFDTNIKTAVETVVSALQTNHQLYLDGVISEETSVEIAKSIVRDTRYSSAADKINDGYFWADMADGFCVVHYNPANEGMMRWDWQDSEGTYFIRDFIHSGDSGGGYTEFHFGKPGDEGGSYQKRGYTLKFEPYGWYISTGNYYEDTDAVIDEIRNTKYTDLYILFLTSLATVSIGLFLVSKNLNRVVVLIIKISGRVHRLSMGDTTTGDIVRGAKDEIGELHESIVRVVNIIHKLIESINTMITEQENGNIDYSFDTNDFLGDYKTLANSVLELASFGMRDQLTGIPNRRSFDNRLDMEWKRAVREKSPISFMLLDIDKFKNYNDTLGHQQGDVALQTVAKTIRQSARRSIDFAARWGGEEFVVLLPATEAEGAIGLAEKIRENVGSVLIPCEDARGNNVTVSIGVTTVIPEPNELVGNFIIKADEALYKAKETGRNRVVFFEG